MSLRRQKNEPGLLVYPLSLLTLLISLILLVSHLQTTPAPSVAYISAGPLDGDHVVSAVYVNLDHSPTRRNLMELRWRKKIKDLARFPAVSADEIIKVSTNRLKATAGETALLTSTLRAFKNFIETDHTAHALLVMDDDVTDTLYSTWTFSLEEVAELASKMAPQWGVVRLGYAYRGVLHDEMAFRFPFIFGKLRRVYGSFANMYSRAFVVKALELYPLTSDGFIASVTGMVRVDGSFLHYVLQQSGTQELLLYPQMMQVDPLEWLTQTGVRSLPSSSSESLRDAIDGLELDYSNSSHLASYARALLSASMFNSITRSGELLGLGSTRDELIVLAHGYLNKWHPSLVNEIFNIWSGDYMKGGKLVSSWRLPSTPFYGGL